MTFRIHWILWSLLLFTFIAKDVYCGGRMIDPPMRSSMWRFNFGRFYANYDDMNLNCGGWHKLWLENGGECGVCGDPANGPYSNEHNGIYDKKVIGRYYEEGQTINISVDFTAAEGGVFRFSLCDRDSDLTQDCFDQYPLQRESDGKTWVSAPLKETIFTDKFILPSGLTCSNCVLQWNNTLGNNFNCDYYANGTMKECCLGCGAQGRTVNCADVQIIPARSQVPAYNPCRWGIDRSGCNGYQTTESLIVNLNNSTKSNPPTPAMPTSQSTPPRTLVTQNTSVSPQTSADIPSTTTTTSVTTSSVKTMNPPLVTITNPPTTSEAAKLTMSKSITIVITTMPSSSNPTSTTPTETTTIQQNSTFVGRTTQSISTDQNATNTGEKTSSVANLNAFTQYGSVATAPLLLALSNLQLANPSLPLLPGVAGSSNNDKSDNLLFFLITIALMGSRLSSRTPDTVVFVPVHPHVPIAKPLPVNLGFFRGSPAPSLTSHVSVAGSYGNRRAVNGHSASGTSRDRAITTQSSQRQRYRNLPIKQFQVISQPKIAFDNVPAVIREHELNTQQNFLNKRTPFVQAQQNTQTRQTNSPLLIPKSYMDYLPDGRPIMFNNSRAYPIFHANKSTKQNTNTFSHSGRRKHFLRSTVTPPFMPKRHSLIY